MHLALSGSGSELTWTEALIDCSGGELRTPLASEHMMRPRMRFLLSMLRRVSSDGYFSRLRLQFGIRGGAMAETG